jgi:hypothetical protein
LFRFPQLACADACACFAEVAARINAVPASKVIPKEIFIKLPSFVVQKPGKVSQADVAKSTNDCSSRELIRKHGSDRKKLEAEAKRLKGS